MRKDVLVRLAGLAIMLTLISSALVSGTYAKYAQAVTGSDTARVAKFAFNLTSGTTTATQSQVGEASFDIFSTTDTGLYNSGAGASFIAPGTTGTLELDVGNLSEVKVSVAFALAETFTNMPDGVAKIPLYYTIDGDDQRYSDTLAGVYDDSTNKSYKTLAELGSALAASLPASDGTVPQSKKVTLNWTWPFAAQADVNGQSDPDDTALGIAVAESPAAAPSVKLAVTVTVSQIDEDE